MEVMGFVFFFSSRRRHTRWTGDWSSDVCSSDLDGALVGVPFAKDAYGAQLHRSQWGLVEVAQMKNYKGTIWATWDRSAPSFEGYLGGYKLYLDLLLDAWDGREGGTEVIGGTHKWLIPCNWKFPAENFSGDRYHGVSHRSVDMVGIGPSGKGRRDMGERNQARWLDVSFPDLGHSMIAFLRPHDAPLAPAYQDAPIVARRGGRVSRSGVGIVAR